jgi:hypothetical protein
MNDDMRLRSAINLDELERQLREASSLRASAQRSVLPEVDDPLAELARLVGQAKETPSPTDPAPHYNRHLAAEPFQQSPPPDNFGEPSAARYDYRGEEFAPAASGRYDDGDPQAHAPQTQQGEGGFPPSDPLFVEPEPLDPSLYGEDEALEKPRSRKGVFILGALLVVAGGGYGIASYLGKDTPKLVNGAPPVIVADKTPAKVAPPPPASTDTPNQNIQVYNRAAPDDTKKATVVASEEQPVDVNAAPRPTGGGAPRPAVASNDARKIKTVTVRPDGTIVEEGASPLRLPTAPPAPSVTQLPPGVLPQGAPTATPGSSANASKSAPPATTTTAAAPIRMLPPARPETTRNEIPQRTASVAAPAAAPAPPPVAASTPVAAPEPFGAPQANEGSGDFAVQLAAPGSEAEARDAIAKFQKRFTSELAGYALSARRAEVGSKTLYRVRVGGLSREDAASLCQKLKAAGGDCFTSRN